MSWRSCSRRFGFTAVSKHRSKNVIRYKQGDINFILNMEPSGQPAAFRGQHGQGANAMAFRVKDAAKAYAEALKRGAEPAFGNVGPMELNIPAIQAIGGAYIYLVDRYGAHGIYDIDFMPIPGAEREEELGRPHLSRPPHAQPVPRQHGQVGELLRDASSTSARSATSTSRASRPASSRRR